MEVQEQRSAGGKGGAKSLSKQVTFVLSRVVTNLVSEISPWTALIYILTQQSGLGLPDLGNITEVVFAHRYSYCKKVSCCCWVFFGFGWGLFFLTIASQSQIATQVSSSIGSE